MLFNFFNELKNAKDENLFLTSIVENLEDLKDKIEERIKDINIEKSEKLQKGELYYVYAYSLPNVYVTKQGSDKVEILDGVSDEFKRNLAEGFILRYKDGEYTVDEVLTEKSMNFELDFDNYKE